ncbi:Putative ecdysteroid kinase [Gryllus bimaculatus]|nr:Putative ecdysteroid kinase [Gryllus bimaculatus]
MSPNSEEIRRQLEQDEDGSWIDNRLLEEILEDGAVVLRIDLKPATSKGDNFLSILHKTYVEYRLPRSNEVRVKKLIVKGLPSTEFLRKYVADVHAFDREIEVYGEVLPRLYAFADARLGDNSFERFSAGYHKVVRPNTLILDDLNEEGFVVPPRRDRLDFAQSRLVIENLARFHALSAVYAEHRPNYISHFDDKLYCSDTRDTINNIYTPQIISIVQEIRTWGCFEHIAKKLEALKDTLVDKLIELRNPVKPERNVLIHGDCWINNILFKYSESNQPIEVRFVDFQMTHASSPAIDLNFFLFSSPRKEVREKRFEDLLHIYCHEFKQWTSKLDYKGTPFTLEEIREEINRTLLFGFASVITTMAVVLADPEDSPDLSKVTEEQAASGEGMNMFEKVYKSSAFRDAFEYLLPYFDSRGVFE